jgi:hypothetical protein
MNERQALKSPADSVDPRSSVVLPHWFFSRRPGSTVKLNLAMSSEKQDVQRWE